MMWKLRLSPLGDHYLSKRHRRLMSQMRVALKDGGVKMGLGPGIVFLRDRFYVTMSPGALLRFFLFPLPACLASWTLNMALRRGKKTVDYKFNTVFSVCCYCG